MKIEQDILKILSLCEIEEQKLTIAGHLDRMLYIKTNKVLEAAGGKWNRKDKAHVFADNAYDAIEQIMLTGEITTPQELGAFFTPPNIVKRLIELAGVRPSMTVLEPSAGIGNISKELDKITMPVVSIEINRKYCDELVRYFMTETFNAPTPRKVICADFLVITPDPIYDRVVMNPPFAKQADIDHVCHALKFLKPGGKLASVMSAGVLFRENRKTVEFRNLIANHSGSIEKLPEGAFKESGTMINAVIVVIPN